MVSEGITLKCNACHAMWTLQEYGDLKQEAFAEKSEKVKRESSVDELLSIPDWYEKERKIVIGELGDSVEKIFSVSIKALPNEKGFVDMGTGTLLLDSEKFVLTFDNKESIIFKHKSRESVQTEYNYAGTGMCIVLSTKDCCYYIYSGDKTFNPTELQFIGEYLYSKNNNFAADCVELKEIHCL